VLEALGLINGYESLPPHTPGLAPWVVDMFSRSGNGNTSGEKKVAYVENYH
jgi:hypothetical protein